MPLNDSEKKNIINVRLENAAKVLNDAKLLCETESYRSAVNRVYYSMFYAVSALAIKKNNNFKKHSALITFFHREFIKTNIFDRKHGRALQKAFEDRSESDYQDFIIFSKEKVLLRIQDAEKFISVIKNYLMQS